MARNNYIEFYVNQPLSYFVLMNWMLLTAKALHKIARFIEVKLSLDEKLPPNVKIHTSSKFTIARLRLKNGCSVTIDEQSQIGGSLFFDRENASISIGKRVFMNGTIVAAQTINIGDDVLIAWGVTIIDHNSHSVSFSQRSEDVVNLEHGKKEWTNVKIAPVKICSKVWIGFNSIILKGVTINEGAVVGAGSVVTKDVPAWTVVAGNPARVIREISEDEC